VINNKRSDLLDGIYNNQKCWEKITRYISNGSRNWVKTGLLLYDLSDAGISEELIYFLSNALESNPIVVFDLLTGEEKDKHKVDFIEICTYNVSCYLSTLIGYSNKAKLTRESIKKIDKKIDALKKINKQNAEIDECIRLLKIKKQDMLNELSNIIE